MTHGKGSRGAVTSGIETAHQATLTRTMNPDASSWVLLSRRPSATDVLTCVIAGRACYSSSANPVGFDARVAEWQTRWLQVPVPVRAWRFNSSLAHKPDSRLARGGNKRLGLFLASPHNIKKC